MKIVSLAIAIAASCLACGAPQNASSTKTPSPTIEDSPLPLADMRYVAEDDETGKVVVTVEVHADGAIDAHGKPSAHIVDRTIVCNDGTELLRVDDRGGVVIEGKVVARLRADGSFAMDPLFGSWSVTVRDSGDVELTSKNEGKASTHALRWEPFHVEARRTASLLTGFLTPPFAGMWCDERKPTKPQ
jgi:hypothetical protein